MLADDFVSVNGQESQAGFWQLIPDLHWDVQEVLVNGDEVALRSRASGTGRPR